jgi:hypothetical protein
MAPLFLIEVQGFQNVLLCHPDGGGVYCTNLLRFLVPTNDTLMNRHPEVPIAIVEKGLLNSGDASLRKLRFSMTGRSCHCPPVNAKF